MEYAVQFKEQESKLRKKMTEACQNLYERYSNDAINEIHRSSRATSCKFCNSLVGAQLDWGFPNLGLLQNGGIEISPSITLTTPMQHITKVLRGTVVTVENVTAAYRNNCACAAVCREPSASHQTESRNLRSLVSAMFVQERRGNSGSHGDQYCPILAD